MNWGMKARKVSMVMPRLLACLAGWRDMMLTGVRRGGLGWKDKEFDLGHAECHQGWARQAEMSATWDKHKHIAFHDLQVACTWKATSYYGFLSQ